MLFQIGISLRTNACIGLLSFWCILWTAFAEAQSVQKYLRRWTVEDGLPSNNISDVWMDDRHYLWVGTANGLCRFNGKEFEQFVDDPNAENRLKGDFVRSVRTDSNGYVYVLIHGGGLCRYNSRQPEKGFQEIIPASAFPKLKGLGVTSFILSIDTSAIYLMYDDTVRVFKNSDKSLTPFDPFAGHTPYGGFQIKYTRSIRPLPDLIASWHKESGVIVYSISNGDIKYISPPGFTETIRALNPPNAQIRFNIIDPYLLVFLESGHYWLFNWKTDSLLYSGVVPLPPGKRYIKGGPFSDETFTYSYDSEAIYQYDPRSNKSGELTYIRMVDDSISISFRGHTETPDGSSWVLTNHGLILKNKDDRRINNFETRISGHTYEKDPTILAFASTSKQPILVSNRNGMQIYDTGKNEFTIPEFYERGKRISTSGFIFSGRDRVFVIENGIKELNLENFSASTIHLQGQKEDIALFKSSTTTYVLRDERMSGLSWWIGTSKGLFTWNAESHWIGRIPLSPDLDSVSYLIRAMCFDPYDRLFIACIKTGMYFIDTKLGTVSKQIHKEDYNAYGIPEGYISSAIRTKGKYVWVAVQSAGLVRLSFDRDSVPQAVTFAKDKGLYNLVLAAAQADQSGNIWISSQSGIEKWDDRYERFFHYGPEHGIIDNEFRLPAYKDEQGKMFFASRYKFVAFHPDSLKLQIVPPRVFVKRIQVNAITRSDLLEKEYIRLKPAERNMILQFDAIEFRNPKKILFRYKINKAGQDDQPWTTTSSFEVALASLSPGSYQILYNAANEHGFWNEKDYAITVYLPKPWYATWWFIILCMGVLSGLLYMLYRYRIRQIKKIMLLRNRISRDLHDDIGSTLGSISIYSEVAKTTRSENRADVLDKIGDASREMLEKLNDIVWSINPENDTLERMEKRMRSYAAMLLNPMGIRFELVLNALDQTTRLDMEHRRNVFLIYKEALHNAAKYAACKHIDILLEEHQGHLRMEIRDDGIGFAPGQDGVYNGIGLTSMQERAKSIGASLRIDSKPGAGTKIYLMQK